MTEPVGVGRERFHYWRPLNSVILKGGGGDFTGDLGGFSAIGVSWGVAFDTYPIRFVGVEIGYDGSRNELDALANPYSERVVFGRNGASALLKVCAPYEGLRPFVGMGFGLFSLSVQGATSNAFYRSGLSGELPFAVGFEVASHGWTAGFRFTYWVLLGDTFAAPGGVSLGGGFMEVQSTLGVRF